MVTRIYPSAVRHLGYLPADHWTHYVEASDGNVWTVDTRGGSRSNRGPIETFDPSRWRFKAATEQCGCQGCAAFRIR